MTTTTLPPFPMPSAVLTHRAPRSRAEGAAVAGGTPGEARAGVEARGSAGAAASANVDALARVPGIAATRNAGEVDRLVGMLRELREATEPLRRIVHAGDCIFRAGDRFASLYVLNTGAVKLMAVSADGRQQMAGLRFKGDWLGFDGITSGHHGCDAVAMDTGEVWSIGYAALMQACVRHPSLMLGLHEAMSREIRHDRDTRLSLCALPADARVADFLRDWAESLAQRGLRNDQILLQMTRAEIGNCLGMTLETVSRVLTRLARLGLIRFAEKGRRDIGIPDVAALAAFVQGSLVPSPVTLQ